MKNVNYIKDLLFKNNVHPYKIYEKMIEETINSDSVLLDAGCGRSAPVLSKFEGKCTKLFGVDLESNETLNDNITYINCDIASIPIDDNSIDVVISRAVLEHVDEPHFVFREIHRILKKNGTFIFLVPNKYDYNSIAATIIPNKFHPKIVSIIEGRDVTDVFPVYYKANSKKEIINLCRDVGYEIEAFEYIGQYPSNFMFSSILFAMASIYEKLIENVNAFAFLRGWILVKLVKKAN